MMDILNASNLEQLIKVPFAFALMILAFVFYKAYTHIIDIVKILVSLIEKIIFKNNEMD